MEIVPVEAEGGGNSMVGICYLQQEEAIAVRTQVDQLCRECGSENAFWEEALYHNGRMIIQAKVVHGSDMIEINTYEQLRDLDSNSDQLKSEAITVILNALNVKPNDITGITTLKKGMTNRSFLFACKGKRYIMRIPGEGTGQLINREQEAAVYQKISGKGICDNNVYINPENGYKITEFITDSRVCDPEDRNDVIKCMRKLRDFHEMNLQVGHAFDLYKQIEFYEALWPGKASVYRDYAETKKGVFSLKNYIAAHITQKSLTHIDAVPDNFLFSADEQGNEKLFLIDWEYAGMQDPHVDLAMFCVYSFYSRQQIDELIQIYFDGKCQEEIKIKIYCYVAACGLLWSNWCEYKRSLGVDFGEYSLRQYRYAKEYYRIVRGILGEEGEKWDIR